MLKPKTKPEMRRDYTSLGRTAALTKPLLKPFLSQYYAKSVLKKICSLNQFAAHLSQDHLVKF